MHRQIGRWTRNQPICQPGRELRRFSESVNNWHADCSVRPGAELACQNGGSSFARATGNRKMEDKKIGGDESYNCRLFAPNNPSSLAGFNGDCL